MAPPEISEENEAEVDGGSGKKKWKKKKTEDTEQEQQYGEKKKKSKEKYPMDGEDVEELPGDPFVFIAKKMGKAGKHFWKKVAQSGKGEKGVVGEENGQSGNVLVVAPTKGEGEPRSTSERPRDGEQDAKGSADLKTTAPDHEASLSPDLKGQLSPEETTKPSLLEEGKGEKLKPVLKTDTAELDEKMAASSAPIPNPTPIS